MSSSRTGSSSGRKKPAFLAAGQQGCVYDGEFGVIRGKTEGCEAVPGSMMQPRMITKIMKSKEVYIKEIAAARVLVKEDPGMRVAVYATRGCTIKIQDVLNEDDIEHCNEKKDIDKDKLIKTDTGYSIEMPYVRHTTLEDAEPSFLENIEYGWKLFKQLEEHIQQLHVWGIYHKDLHPGNVWLIHGEDGSVSLKIADFGCAVISSPNDKTLQQADIRIAAPSFKKLWNIIDSRKRPRAIDGDVIEYFVKSGRFYGWTNIQKALESYIPEKRQKMGTTARSLF